MTILAKTFFCRQKPFFPAKTIFASLVLSMEKTFFSTIWQKLANPGMQYSKKTFVKRIHISDIPMQYVHVNSSPGIPRSFCASPSA